MSSYPFFSTVQADLALSLHNKQNFVGILVGLLTQFGAWRYAHNRQIAEFTVINYLPKVDILLSRFTDLLVENDRSLISLPARHLFLLAIEVSHALGEQSAPRGSSYRRGKNALDRPLTADHDFQLGRHGEYRTPSLGHHVVGGFSQMT